MSSSQNHPSFDSQALFLQFSQQALNLQTQFQSKISHRELNLQTKLSSLISSLDSKILSIKAYHKSLLLYEKELQNLCFATMDDFETKIKDLEYLINNETSNLLTNLTQNIAITVSNSYFSLLHELKDFYSSKSAIDSLNFSSFRPHFSSMFQAFEIEIPKEFIDSANTLELELTKTYKSAFNAISFTKENQGDNDLLLSSIKKKTDLDTEDDDIDKKMKLLEEKIEGSTPSMMNRNKNEQSSEYQEISRSKSQTDDSNKRSGGFFSKMKNIFKKKKNNELEEFATATEMKLGDDSNKFRYDPIKKKYIFEGEEEEPEEVIPPPLVKSTPKHHNDAGSKTQEDTKAGSRDSLIKPPIRSYIHKKKEIPKKNIEKFTVFNPNDVINKETIVENNNNIENFDKKPEIQSVKKKVKYSESISNHFEKIVKNMKEKINDFLENRLKKNELFYSEINLNNCKKSMDPYEILENNIKHYFKENLMKFTDFHKELIWKPEENKENLLTIFQKKGNSSQDNVDELTKKMTEKSRENIALEKDIIKLQSKYFSLLNDNLCFIMQGNNNETSKTENSHTNAQLIKGLFEKYEDIKRYSKENNVEIMDFLQKNIEENRIFYLGIIEKLMEKCSININEKKHLYEFSERLLKIKSILEIKINCYKKDLDRLKKEIEEIKHVCDISDEKLRETYAKNDQLRKEIVEIREISDKNEENHKKEITGLKKILEEIKNLSDENQRKDEKEIVELQRKLVEINSIYAEKEREFLQIEENFKRKIEETALKNNEFKINLEETVRKYEFLLNEIKDERKNYDELLIGDEISHILVFIHLEKEEINPMVSSNISKFKYLFIKIYQKLQQIINEKNEKIQFISTDFSQLTDRFHQEKEYLSSEISMKQDLIQLNSEKIETLSRHLSSKQAELEELSKDSLKFIEIQKKLKEEINELKIVNLELLQQNNELDAKSKQISNENIRISAEMSHLQQRIQKIDSEMAEKFSGFRNQYSQIEQENHSLKKEISPLKEKTSNSERNLQETTKEIHDLQVRNQDLNRKITDLIKTSDTKYLECEKLLMQKNDETENFDQIKNNLEEALNESNKKTETLKIDIDMKQKENVELKRKFDEFSDNFKIEYEKLRVLYENLRDDYGKLINENERLTNESEKLRNESEKVLQENLSLFKEKEVLLKNYDEINQKLSNELKKNLDLEEKLKEFWKMLQEKQENLSKKNEDYNNELAKEKEMHKKTQEDLERIQKDLIERENSSKLERNSLIEQHNKDSERNLMEFHQKLDDLEEEINRFHEKERVLQKENQDYSEELKHMKNEALILKNEINIKQDSIQKYEEEYNKNEENLLKYKEENEFLRIKLLNSKENEEIINKINDLKEENESLLNEKAYLTDRNYQISQKLDEDEKNIANLEQNIKEWRKQNDYLKEEIERVESERINKGEMEALHKVLEKKSRKIEQLETHEKDLSKNLEHYKKFEEKYKEIEDFNNSLTNEKKKLLEENDNLFMQLNKKDFYVEVTSLKQKLKNLEEEKNILKSNNAEIIDKLNAEIYINKETIETLRTSIENLNNNNIKNATNLNINKNKIQSNVNNTANTPITNVIVPQNTTNEANKPVDVSDTPSNNQINVENKSAGGFIYNLASFFLTEKELKGVKK